MLQRCSKVVEEGARSLEGSVRVLRKQSSLFARISFTGISWPGAQDRRAGAEIGKIKFRGNPPGLGPMLVGAGTHILLATRVQRLEAIHNY